MSQAYRLLLTWLLASMPCVALANTELPYQKEEPNPDIRPMGFDECLEIQREYENEMGVPEVVLDITELRIVKFTKNNEQEEVACDALDHTITLLNVDDED